MENQINGFNMRLVGYNDLQARSAYQPVIHKQGGRYIAYVGHHGASKKNPAPHNRLNDQKELNGTSILDVSDARNPKLLSQIFLDDPDSHSHKARVVGDVMIDVFGGICGTLWTYWYRTGIGAPLNGRVNSTTA